MSKSCSSLIPWYSTVYTFKDDMAHIMRDMESFSIRRPKFPFKVRRISAILGLNLHAQCLKLLQFGVDFVCQRRYIVEGLIWTAFTVCCTFWRPSIRLSSGLTRLNFTTVAGSQ